MKIRLTLRATRLPACQGLLAAASSASARQRKRIPISSTFNTLVLLAALTTAAAADGPYFMNLGHLPGGRGAFAYGISADGSVVVGWAGNSNPAGHEAFRWTRAGGMVSLGFLPGGTDSYANAASADGSVI